MIPFSRQVAGQQVLRDDDRLGGGSKIRYDASLGSRPEAFFACLHFGIETPAVQVLSVVTDEATDT